MYRDLLWIVPGAQGLLAGLHHAWVYARSFTAGDPYPGPAHANAPMAQCNTGTAWLWGKGCLRGAEESSMSLCPWLIPIPSIYSSERSGNHTLSVLERSVPLISFAAFGGLVRFASLYPPGKTPRCQGDCGAQPKPDSLSKEGRTPCQAGRARCWGTTSCEPHLVWAACSRQVLLWPSRAWDPGAQPRRALAKHQCPQTAVPGQAQLQLGSWLGFRYPQAS